VTESGTESWNPDRPGVLRLPSGRLVRGRALRRPLPAGPEPTYAVHLLGKRPPEVPWPAEWLRWPDFRLPADPDGARELLREAWVRAARPGERVEIACFGGRGRTGTALACIAVLDGVPAGRAVDFVRRNYDHRAVETPWQRRYVRRFGG
jgi:hypothetical protein